MVFVTAGMGGGTGTGAAPVIAKLAKDMGILTVGIVTSPFIYEGKKRSEQAQIGIEKLRKNVDSLIVINNNKLAEIYGDLGIKESYAKADEILLKGAKGVAEVISKHYIVNIDLRDARTVLENGGTAIMGSAVADGENRALDAISAALNSPLLNDNRIIGAKNALLLIVFGTKQASQREVEEINSYIQAQAGENMADIIMGIGEDEALGESLSVTIIATGFDADQQHKIVNTDPKKIIHTLDEEQVLTHELMNTSGKVTHDLFDEPILEANQNQTKVNTENHKHVEEVAKSVVDMPNINDIMVDYEVIRKGDFVIVDTSKPLHNPIQHTIEKEEEHYSKVQIEQIQVEVTSEEPIVEIFNLLDEEPQKKNEKKENPIAEINKEGQILHSLEDYMELEQTFTQATSKPKPPKPIDDFKLKIEERANERIEVKQKDLPEVTVDKNGQTLIFSEETEEKVDPVNSSISEVLKNRTRPDILKAYNYTFDVSNHERRKPSRTSFSNDSSGEGQIRTNNSFLHDNVD